MYIIAGLGNPDRKYQKTRHNVGFDVAKIIAKKYLPGREKKKFEARMLQGKIEGEDVVLLRPQTYMNNSGLSIRQAADYFKVSADHILIIYDDIALAPGVLRIRKEGSAGGHNGVKSIISHLGTQEFPRIRVGVGSRKGSEDLVDHVLGTFSKEDRAVIDRAEERAAEAVAAILRDGMDRAMNQYNQKQTES